MIYQAIVIGAGQAGLAAAHELTHRGLIPGTDFLILDANSGPGGAWRHRWDSLTLGKAHGIADLPGLKMRRPDPLIPASRLVADYYGAYEEKFHLGVIRPVEVNSVAPLTDDPASPLIVTAGERSWQAYQVLNATGTWTQPHIPYIPGIESFQGTQLHTKNYTRAADFAGKRTLVVGGGLSAVQFLLELAPITDTLWATHRPPNFTERSFNDHWGLAVEKAVRARTHAGLAPASVVRTTGIPLREDYLQGVRDGVLISRGMFDRILPDGVRFGTTISTTADGLGPSASATLVVPESWDPLPAGTLEKVDIIFWNTGFRAALRHLSAMHLRTRSGIEMRNEVTPVQDSRILLVGYGSTASTIGATRAGRLAGRLAAKRAQAPA